MVPLDLWDWKPNPSMRSTAELGNHLACSPLGILELLRGNISNEEKYNDLEKNNMPINAQGLTHLYDQSLSKLLSYLQEHLENARTENIRFFYQDHDTSMYKEAFDEIGHEWFHLGQLYTYLRQNGIPIDMGAYYGYKDPDPNLPPNK